MTNELLERVKAATEPDRALDWRIAEALNIPEPWPASTLWPPFMEMSKFDKAIPAYTASIDAALALVERCLPGWQYGFEHRRDSNGGATAWLAPNEDASRTHGATLPLAILAALLSALSLHGEPHDE